MEYHLMFIVRMLCYLSAVILGSIFMIRLGDSPLGRRVAAAGFVAAVVFNQAISGVVYSLLASVLEVILGIMGFGFVLIAALVLMLLPIILVVGWIKSK